MKTPNQSSICRLCAVNFENGTSLFELEADKEIHTLIDEYLPLKITGDEELPTKICSECKNNVQNVVKFFNSVISGQKLLLKKTKQCIENDETPSKDTAAATPVDNEIRENLKKLFTSTACREIVNYNRLNEENQRQISPSCQNSDDHSTPKDNFIEKDSKYPKNGRKYFTREINKEEKFQSHVYPEDEQTQKVFICDICGKKFSHRSSVLYHFHSKHGENQLYNCNECNKKFSSSRLLKRHFKRIHSMIRMSECIHCHATFITKDQLETHLKSCKRNTLTCQQCKKPYKSRSKHECQKDGIQSREYPCKVCEKTFKYSSNLYRHQKLHSTERPYQCTKCNRKFTTFSRLTMHENEHNKEYSFKCNICQKTFVNNRILRVHYRRHTRVYLYQCDICCKGFPDKGSIAKHIRIHTGERPFSCDSCEKTFADRSNYLRHKKAHSKNQNSSKNQKRDSISRKKIKSTLPKTKLRMEIDYSSMTYSNDNSNKEKSTSSNHLLTEPSTKLHSVENKNDVPFENRNDLKKTFYLDNNSKQFSLKCPRADKNTVSMPPPSTIPPSKHSHQSKAKSSLFVSKSTKTSNSFDIVKKENNTPVLNNSTKVIVIRSRNKNKSKFILQKSLESVVKKELIELPARKEDGSSPVITRNEIKIKQNQLPELYSCEKMPPSPTSEYIDVEDLVATFTPNISFEEIGDLNDLVNTKIDL